MKFTALDPERGLDPYTIDLISRIAALLIRRHGFPSQDREEYEQILRLEVLTKRPRWNPARGAWTTFVTVVLTNKKNSIVRAFRAACREGRPLSLSDLVNCGQDEPVERSQTISNADRSRHIGHEEGDPKDLWEQEQNLNELMKRLTVKERNVVRLKRKGLSLTDLAKVLGISRGVASYRFRRIRDKGKGL